jgi:hypothetical protein
MCIKWILMGLFRARSGKDGIWDFLGKRAAHKSRVELEKARNEGTQKLIPLLGPGMVVREGGGGWMREISVPGTGTAEVVITTTMSSPAITSLTPADLEAPTPQEQRPTVSPPDE